MTGLLEIYSKTNNLVRQFILSGLTDSGAASSVSGGRFNEASGVYSCVFGGKDNTVGQNASYSVISGGTNNEINNTSVSIEVSMMSGVSDNIIMSGSTWFNGCQVCVDE